MSDKIRMENESILRAARKRGLTWIHVSDWHQKDKEFDRRIVRDALIEDIKNRAAISQDLATIDLIIFSGDLAFSGRIEEYLAAKEQFIDPLLEACGLGHDRLFIVPGNHDLDRKAFDPILRGLPDLLKTYDDVKNWLTQENCKAMLMKPFQAFTNFIADCTGTKQGNYASICIWNNIGGKKVALLGLNSAWACGRHIKCGFSWSVLWRNAVKCMERNENATERVYRI
jgi:predicted phosphodiesterase